MSARAASSSEPPMGPIFGDTFTDVGEHYTLGKRLGTGNFAKVVRGELKRPLPQWKLKAGDVAAVKVVKKPSSRRSVERLQMLRAEVEILRSIQHPNIVQLYEVYESQSRLYLVMELLTGGELFDRIVGLGKYTEDDARYFSFKLLNAVLYLHDRNICHRDLKPENILLESKEPDAELKITDFGLSKISSLDVDFLMTTRCGTPGYVAPEVLTQEVTQGHLRKYGTSCDMWSVGVIVYILLCAARPFYGKTDAEMNRRIRAGHYKFPDKYWAHISQPAKDFISRLLTVDPIRRMSASEALQHEWIVSIGVHTNDLFVLTEMQQELGVPVMQARMNEFNVGRRETSSASGTRHEAMQQLLGLPDEEEELHHFRCAHAERAGHLVVTPSFIAFLAYDQSNMFSLPITEIVSLGSTTSETKAAASDSSMRLTMSNGKVVQFDGFWEREECSQLLQACARFHKHTLSVEAADAAAGAAGTEAAEGAAAADEEGAAGAEAAPAEAAAADGGQSAEAEAALGEAMAGVALATAPEPGDEPCRTASDVAV